MFLYGAPGNGKSTLAKRITMCFGQEIWIPHAIYEDGQIIKFYDSAYHKQPLNDERSIMKCGEYDRRWMKIPRPTVVVGGELTMDNLELRHDPRSNINEAPLQMKSNCGCLLIDDFGRQRIEPAQLLNRWIVPLEMRHDFLTLPTGKKMQVPFDQLVIFSTNLEPRDLVDEAFLRRIPFKIEIADPSEEEFHQLFQLYAKTFGCEYRRDADRRSVGTSLPAHQPAAAPLPAARPAAANPQLLHLCAAAHGNAAGIFRPGRKDLLRHRAWAKNDRLVTPIDRKRAPPHWLHRIDDDEFSVPHDVHPPSRFPATACIERIGAGGYGEVWKAEAPGGIAKAIKIVYGYHDDQRATRELSALNRIKEVRHPFVLSLGSDRAG